MPKSKARTRNRSADKATSRGLSWGGHYSTRTRLRDRVVTVLVAVSLIGGLGYVWVKSNLAEHGFQAVAEQGAAALSEVESSASLGRRHLGLGETHHYATAFPTSGPHASTWTVAGFYTRAQQPTQLVHALEHGNVVIYYDTPGEDALALLDAWGEIYGGRWDGLVVTRTHNLGERIVLTAWTKKLELESFDAAAAAAFIDAFRGRGPENPVR